HNQVNGTTEYFLDAFPQLRPVTSENCSKDLYKPLYYIECTADDVSNGCPNHLDDKFHNRHYKFNDAFDEIKSIFNSFHYLLAVIFPELAQAFELILDKRSHFPLDDINCNVVDAAKNCFHNSPYAGKYVRDIIQDFTTVLFPERFQI